MTKIAFEREVVHTPRQMFDLVSDLDQYPSFVPNCSHMQTSDLPGVGRRVARMHVSFGPISQAYDSIVACDSDALTISAVAEDDPFSYLESVWSFVSSPNGTQVKFDLDFELRNRLIASIAEPIFAEKQRQVVDAFIERADTLYGKSR